MKLADFLKQAAEDIITILTTPPSTTTPSLQAGDPVRNALLTLATQLKRIDTIPEPVTIDASSPRVVPTSVPIHLKHDTHFPRVDTSAPSQAPSQTSSNMPVLVLQQPSVKFKNARFQNTVPPKYPLRSLQRKPLDRGTNFHHLAVQHLAAQHLFQPKVNHIFTSAGKKETIDSILNGTNKVVWTQSLRNEWGNWLKVTSTV